MDLSLRWLKDYIDPGVDAKKFCYDMTMTGSKVEGYTVEGAEISNVVVGKILSVAPHENSDHLVITQVDVGAEQPVQIVTGAPNIRENNVGDLVPAALVGATLPNGVKIKKGKLRGVESCGMLCSLGELGLTVHDFPYAIADGIFILKQEEGCPEIKVGMDIKEAIGFNDVSVEFEITSNRPDCLSVLGLAREAHATFDKPLMIKTPSFKGCGGNINDLLKVEVENEKFCPRYIGGVVKNVKVGMSPRWMRERLRASGIRPINNFVDITNYVMLEYGQPMHAFDIKNVAGNEIRVRNARKGEKITTLDGTERELAEEMCVIADAEKPIAVAGVMGGEYSGITDDTETVVFESANFDGAWVRRTAKALGMRTDASARYEKGLDPAGTFDAINRALELVEILGCGEPVSGLIDCDHSSKTSNTVPFDPKWINGFLGTEIPEEDMLKYLGKLGLDVKDGNVIVPAFRIDINCKADVAEEVARIYGYNNIPHTVLKGAADAKFTPEQKFRKLINRTMTALGAYEISTFSFVSPKGFDKICLPEDSKLRKAVTISNPLGEDTSVMRTTIIPSLCEVLARNYNNRNLSVCLFENGTEYIPTEEGKLPEEPARLCIGMFGGGRDFYDIKGMTEQLLEALNINGAEFAPCADDSVFPEAVAFHPGRRALITAADGTPLGMIGELSQKVTDNYGIGARTYVGKLLVPELMAASDGDRVYKPLPKYPASVRDLAIVCDKNIPVAELEKAIRSAAGNILESTKLFDVYTGSQIAEGKKSVAYSITLRSHDGTLTDEQTDSTMKKILKKLSEMGAEIRS